MQAHAIQLRISRDGNWKKRLNHLGDAHFAVTCLPAAGYVRVALHPLLWIMLE